MVESVAAQVSGPWQSARSAVMTPRQFWEVLSCVIARLVESTAREHGVAVAVGVVLGVVVVGWLGLPVALAVLAFVSDVLE